jgi:hypothetical protein
MIPVFIIWLTKKYFQKQEQQQFIKFLLRRIITVTVLLLFSFTLFSQELTHKYAVLYKGDNVGTMQLYVKKSGDEVYMKMVSSVQMRFVFKIDLKSEEEASFKSGRLVFSKIRRQVNGKEKVNNQTMAAGDVYQTSADGKTGCIHSKAIDYNLLLLYNHEPLNITTVYSDNFQQFLTIIKTAEHAYKIELPDGNYNDYFFKDGICNKVEVHHSFYTITMKLL